MVEQERDEDRAEPISGKSDSVADGAPARSPNVQLRAARQVLSSKVVPGECMGRVELAEAVNSYLWEATQKRYFLDGHTIARYERGTVRWPSGVYVSIHG
jgi:hypothetical protein